MTSSEEKPCIQKRVVAIISERLPEFLLAFSIIAFVIITLILENSQYSYGNYLKNLDYNQIKDLINLTVTTNGFLIAFTGVIASVILKVSYEKEERREGESPFFGMLLSEYYKKIRQKIIKFVLVVLVVLTISIGFSFGVIITQFFFYSVLSILCLFIGLIELIGMIVYSLQ